MNETSGTLFVVATPIGNVEDLSPRGCRVLEQVDLIAAEDTRRTRRLLSRIGVETSTISYHDHNEAERCPQLLERLARGESIALVSDAGTPLISDPGYSLVSNARQAGIEVVAIPGPSAAIAALSISGLPADRWVFEGFLPRRRAARKSRIAALSQEPRTIIFFESVHRLRATLADLEAGLGDRPAFLARELTKMHEECRLASLAELAEQAAEGAFGKGEIVLVVSGAPSQAEGDHARVVELYAQLREELAPSDALRVTARLSGVSRNAVYRMIKVE